MTSRSCASPVISEKITMASRRRPWSFLASAKLVAYVLNIAVGAIYGDEKLVELDNSSKPLIQRLDEMSIREVAELLPQIPMLLQKPENARDRWQVVRSLTQHFMQNYGTEGWESVCSNVADTIIALCRGSSRMAKAVGWAVSTALADETEQPLAYWLGAQEITRAVIAKDCCPAAIVDPENISGEALGATELGMSHRDPEVIMSALETARQCVELRPEVALKAFQYTIADERKDEWDTGPLTYGKCLNHDNAGVRLAALALVKTAVEKDDAVVEENLATKICDMANEDPNQDVVASAREVLKTILDRRPELAVEHPQLAQPDASAEHS